jgi:hypothetical protein
MHSTPALAAECKAKDTAWPPAVQAPREREYCEPLLLAADLPYAVVTVRLLGSCVKPKKRRLCRRVIASGFYVHYVHICAIAQPKMTTDHLRWQKQPKSILTAQKADGSKTGRHLGKQKQQSSQKANQSPKSAQKVSAGLLMYVRLCPLNISFVDGPKFAACCLGFSQQLGAASLVSRQHLVMI